MGNTYRYDERCDDTLCVTCGTRHGYDECPMVLFDEVLCATGHDEPSQGPMALAEREAALPAWVATCEKCGRPYRTGDDPSVCWGCGARF